MSSRQNEHSDDPRQDHQRATEGSGLYDDAALRDAIARLISEDDGSGAASPADRQQRIESLRQQIKNGEYMSDQKLGDIVDRLMKKWQL